MKIFKSGKEYSVGIYCRLSKEDGDKIESESISNQRSILNRFCEENELRIYKEYADDGISGLNFNRPKFNEMIKDIENNKINMVVVKDLSRLGRDYTEVGRYIEKYFPEHNIRFIALYDDVDTITQTDDMLPLRTVLNDLYCKDVSRKIRAMLINKKKEGQYISVVAPYGYKKDPNKKGHLIIDEEESTVVKKIYEMFLNGMGTYQITKKLNIDKFDTPSKTRSNITSISGKWNAKTVRGILTNEIYIGNTVQGKRRKVNYKSKKIINLNENEWIIVKNTHEPIISKDDFEMVSEILKNKNNFKVSKYSYLLKGIVICKDCGCAIVWNTKKDKYKDKITIRRYGVCPTATKNTSFQGENKKCRRKYINYDKIEKIVFEKIRSLLNAYINDVDLNKIKKYRDKIQNEKISLYSEKIKALENEINKINEKIDKIYIDKLDNLLSLDDFTRISTMILEKKNNVSQKLDKTIKYYNELVTSKVEIDDKKMKKQVKEILNDKNFEEKNLLNFIDKIYVDKDKNIDIIFKFRELKLYNEYV